MSLYNQILSKNFKFLGIKSNANVLDVGCGNGDVVHKLLMDGFNSFGIDLEFKEGNKKRELLSNERIKLIDIGVQTRKSLNEGNIYSWPNFKIKFDVVISKAVIEHVRNFEEFVGSIKMVLKNHEGICIHYYPSKYSLIEQHTGVFLGSIIQSRIWFLIMCQLGLCFKSKRNKGDEAFSYMQNYTFFRSQKEIDNKFKKQGFQKLKCIQVLSCHNNKIIRLIGLLPFANILFGIFRSQVAAYKRV